MVTCLKWVAPIMNNEDVCIQICGDNKITVNQTSKLDNYPNSKTEDLQAKTTGGQKLNK